MDMAQRQHLHAPWDKPELRAATPAHGQEMGPTPSRAIVVFATDYVSEAFSTALSASGAKVEGFRPERAEAALSDPGASCVILWQDPADVVAAAMEAGQDLVEVTEAWLTSARTVLSLFRRNRRRLLLVDARVLTPHAPPAERETLRARLQLEALAAPVDKPAEPARRMAQLLASLMLPQIPSIRKCLDELEAGSLSLAPGDFSVADLSAVAGTFQRISDQAARLEGLAEENTLLKSQVSLQQSEAERFLEEHRFASLAAEKSLARALADLRTEAKSRAKLQDERDRLAQREKDLSTRLDSSEKSLARAQTDLRTEAKSRAKLQDERDRLSREVKTLSRKLDKVFTTTSWKVTRPLRKMKLLFSGGSLPMDEAIAAGKQKPAKR